ncbi:hypothetical protein QQ056_19720 [Oscillatoria laete-virens NRMC-F 0139]|nr:hypothetical protein [Oscillatoria laete-virens]MDL5055760.1 hypothetical protein [Oscillatoria laete-virens NRMC-F 0139]
MQKIRMVDGTVDTSLRNLGYDYPHELDQLKNIIILNNDLSPINNRVTIDFQNVSWQDVLNFTFLGGGLKNETVIMGAVINSPTQDEDYIYRFEYRIDEKTAQKIIDVYKPKKINFVLKTTTSLFDGITLPKNASEMMGVYDRMRLNHFNNLSAKNQYPLDLIKAIGMNENHFHAYHDIKFNFDTNTVVPKPLYQAILVSPNRLIIRAHISWIEDFEELLKRIKMYENFDEWLRFPDKPSDHEIGRYPKINRPIKIHKRTKMKTWFELSDEFNRIYWDKR